MSDDITILRATWNALEMELLTPARLSDADFAAILGAREQISSNDFAAQLPMTVAHFKQAAQDEIYARALAKGSAKEDDYIAEKFKADISKINQIFFGAGIERSSAMLGLFDHAFAGYVHSDGDGQPKKVFYLSRLFSLPLLVIKNQSQWLNDPEIAKLIFTALNEMGERDIAARQELMNREILEKCILGDVMMLRMGSNEYDLKGTLHASFPVPPEGLLSALIAAKGQNSPFFR